MASKEYEIRQLQHYTTEATDVTKDQPDEGRLLVCLSKEAALLLFLDRLESLW